MKKGSVLALCLLLLAFSTAMLVLAVAQNLAASFSQLLDGEGLLLVWAVDAGCRAILAVFGLLGVAVDGAG